MNAFARLMFMKLRKYFMTLAMGLAALMFAPAYAQDELLDEAAAEEAEKIDLDLDEFESYVEQYLEYDDRRSVNAIKALGSAKAYSAKLKLKKKKMSSAQLSRYESIKSRY